MSKILEQIIDIISIGFDISKEEIRDNLDTNLFVPPYSFVAEDLLYLFFKVEDIFKVKISEKDLTDMKFSSINKIYNILQFYIDEE